MPDDEGFCLPSPFSNDNFSIKCIIRRVFDKTVSEKVVDLEN